MLLTLNTNGLITLTPETDCDQSAIAYHFPRFCIPYNQVIYFISSQSAIIIRINFMGKLVSTT
jgi:hypothetical protein